MKTNRLISVALVTIMALTVVSGAGVLTASGAQQTTQSAHAHGYHTVPLVGVFSGKSEVRIGAYVGNGPGLFALYGRLNVQVSKPVVPNPPYIITITTTNGDTLSLSVPNGSDTFQVQRGTGRFANVVGGTGHFSLEPGLTGQQEPYRGYLYGTVVFAF